jgi:DNA gyrase/topoisomerase IV subunit B
MGLITPFSLEKLFLADKEFEVLDDRSHCLLRPNVYIGSCVPEPQTGIYNYKVDTKTVTPGLLKIISEIIDNSTDEFIRTNGKYANKIDISIEETLSGTQVVVSDNGRGIPLGDINGTPQPVLAWTALRAGSNFDDSKRVGAGTNGMGSALTNIFSREFVGITSDGKNSIEVTCYDNMKEVKFTKKKTTKQGTTVSFVPDLDRFGLSTFDEDHESMVIDRLQNLAITYRGISYTFNGKPIKAKNAKEIATNFHENAVSFEYQNILFVFAPIGKNDSYNLACANGIRVSQGGSHVDFVMNKVVESIRTFIKKKHKIDVMPAAIKSNIMFASWINNFPALKFDSQSKERITNSVAEVSAFFSDIDFDKIGKKLIETPDIIDPIIQAILYKKELEEMRELAKKAKEGKKKIVVNHIAATDPNPENRMLLLCEGLSAISSLLNVRNAKTTGGYPLKGKVMNINGMRPLEIVKNVEIQELLSIIGLQIGEPASNLNYGKIVSFTDGDLDGNHIHCLLLNLFSLWPELYKQKRIYRLKAPMFHCKKGKTDKFFYTYEEYSAFDSSGYTVNYYKGLGSMSEDVYAKVVNDPYLELVTEFNPEILEMAFGGDADARKDWMMK